MNSLMIDSSVSSPYRTSIALGGISMPSVPAAAMVSVASASETP